MFIEVTHDGKKELINLNRILALYPGLTDGCRIVVDLIKQAETFIVLESYEQVRDKLFLAGLLCNNK